MEFWRIWSILWRRKWVLVGAFVLFFLAVVLGTHLISPTYEAQAKIAARLPDPYLSIASALDVSTRTVSDELGNFDTLANMASARPVLDKVIARLELKDRKGEVLEATRIVKSSMARKVFPEPYVEVEQVDNSGILEITATSGDAEEAAAICNTLAEEFKAARLERFRNDFGAAAVEMQRRLPAVRAKYETALSELAEFRKEIGSIDMEAESSDLLNKISSLKNSLESDERSLAELETRNREIRLVMKDLDEFRKESSEIGLDDITVQLRTRFNELLQRRASTAVSITREHPDYSEIEAELEAVADLLAQRSDMRPTGDRLAVDPTYQTLREELITNTIDMETARVRMELTRRYLAGYESDLLKVPDWSMTLAQKEIQVVVMRSVYAELWSQVEEVETMKDLLPEDFVMIEPAVTPTKVKFPLVKVNYVIGLFLGAFWALAAALFVEYIDIPREQRLAAGKNGQ